MYFTGRVRLYHRDSALMWSRVGFLSGIVMWLTGLRFTSSSCFCMGI